MAMVGTRGLLLHIMAREKVGRVVKIKTSLLTRTLLHQEVVLQLPQGKVDIIIEDIRDTQEGVLLIPLLQLR